MKAAPAPALTTAVPVADQSAEVEKWPLLAQLFRRNLSTFMRPDARSPQRPDPWIDGVASSQRWRDCDTSRMAKLTQAAGVFISQPLLASAVGRSYHSADVTESADLESGP